MALHILRVRDPFQPGPKTSSDILRTEAAHTQTHPLLPQPQRISLLEVHGSVRTLPLKKNKKLEGTLLLFVR